MELGKFKSYMREGCPWTMSKKAIGCKSPLMETSTMEGKNQAFGYI